MTNSKIKEQGLSYDDVLIIPQRSPVNSRSNVETKTQLTPNIELQVPIISANMDTVTEARMAIAMARMGGIGIIHRFMPIEKQVQEIKKVKRAENFIIEDPYTIEPDKTVQDVKNKMTEKEVGGLLVCKKDKKLLGIITKRDIRFADDNTKVSKAMTSEEDLITASPSITIEKAEEIISKNKIEKLPLVNESGRIKGLITSKDIYKIKNTQHPTKDKNKRLRVGASVGLGNYLENTRKLIDAGADLITLDVAHGHMEKAIKAVEGIKSEFKQIDLIAGNVATAQGVKDLAEAGADTVKIGVGPGSMCTTREKTGAGYPQFSAVLNSTKVADELGVNIVADGGIKNSGDITKAIGAGADTVMIGGMFAGTKESPGTTIMKDGRKFKIARGMASLGAAQEKDKNPDSYTPEGVEGITPYKGSVKEIITKLLGGLRSGMSYTGATNIDELKEKARFVKITPAGLKENKTRGLEFSF